MASGIVWRLRGVWAKVMGSRWAGWWVLLAGLVVTTVVYAPGLSGGWLFDDYPNIVANEEVQPNAVSVSSLVGAALSSPSSRFKRPLASLSFAMNYLASGLNPYAWKVTNLVIHLLNGLLVFLLVQRLLLAVAVHRTNPSAPNPPLEGEGLHVAPSPPLEGEGLHSAPTPPLEGEGLHVGRSSPSPSRGEETRLRATGSRVDERPNAVREGRNGPGWGWGLSLPANHVGIVAALVASAWMLLPINLTAVLYVVQRMESLANLFVLLGLIGYMAGRTRMRASRRGGFALVIASLIVPTLLGLMAKETAVLLPLYALLIEWIVFGFRSHAPRIDKRMIGLFLSVLLLPMLLGLAWILPSLFNPATWARRDFTLGTRLLSEARIVVDYIGWTILPLPQSLSFYHDQFQVSTGLLTPWTTLLGMLVIATLLATVYLLRRRAPLIALGIALYFACHLLTGTVLNLELIYEHRNYFASLGLMLAIVPPLAAPLRALPWVLARRALLASLLLWWAAMTAITAWTWGEPLRLAEELATRAANSPRAQYELGRTYIIYSHYDPESPFTELAYAPLIRAAALPDSSILPEQALIFMNARLGRPIKEQWWASLLAKLKSKSPGVQDESSLAALTKCVRSGACTLDHSFMVAAFRAALSHPNPSARLAATYADYAWNVLDDFSLGLRMAEQAVAAKPQEPAYHITLARMYLALGRDEDTREQIAALRTLNIGGRLDTDIAALQKKLNLISAEVQQRNSVIPGIMVDDGGRRSSLRSPPR